ncbi:hypothetical protein QAD02_020769 [Eretmocerus hayati]|uniref:Uncharacterized protein n=1 Tax=Eretmocerus hayati TaxID=131215 RepID=A0ACC2PPM7_9HYME|nr:hypothetical protein QAD02_020769 [Eretmocerus hayati]
MMNLMKHSQDFGISAEWHCYALAHGKSSSDGVGAIVKTEATRASLQVPPNEAILNADALFSWATKWSNEMKFLYYSKTRHELTRRSHAKRFKDPPAVIKIQKAHAFIPHAMTHYEYYAIVMPRDPR